MDRYSGKCLCGAVQFAIRPPSKFIAHCHCRYCRQAHGAPFVTWVGVPDAQFELVESEALRWYQSSGQGRRGFCETCGSTMFYASELSAGEIHVVRACIDADVIDREPAAHVFFDQKVDWVELGDSLPKLASDSKPLAKYKAVPG